MPLVSAARRDPKRRRLAAFQTFENLAAQLIEIDARAAPGVELVEEGDYPTAVGDAVGQDAVYVGRVRRGIDGPRELNLWIASDNVRKGAALNAVQSAELLIKHYL